MNTQFSLDSIVVALSLLHVLLLFALACSGDYTAAVALLAWGSGVFGCSAFERIDREHKS